MLNNLNLIDYDFAFKDLYNFVIEYIKKEKELDSEVIEKYCEELQQIISKKNTFLNCILESENLDNNIKFLCLYNVIIEILVLKLININPIFFYEIFDTKKVAEFIDKSDYSNYISKPISDINIIKLALKHNIVDLYTHDSLLAMKNNRNNFSAAHCFNERIHESYFQSYKDVFLKLVNIKVKFKVLANNVRLFIEKISSIENFDQDINQLIKREFIEVTKNKKNSDQLDYCFSNIFLVDYGILIINEKLLILLLSNIENDVIIEYFLLRIMQIINILKIDNKYFSILNIFNFCLKYLVFVQCDKFYSIVKQVIFEFAKAEGPYYRFSRVNKIISNFDLINYFLFKSEQKGNDYPIDFYNWILTANPAGFAYKISEFEFLFSMYSSLHEKLKKTLGEKMLNGDTKITYRNRVLSSSPLSID